MDNLVTDAAVEEVAKILVREQSSGLCTFGEECFNCDCNGAKDRDRYALLHSRLALETAAPHIVAKALRRAALRAVTDWMNEFASFSSDAAWVVNAIKRYADELESKQ